MAHPRPAAAGDLCASEHKGDHAYRTTAGHHIGWIARDVAKDARNFLLARDIKTSARSRVPVSGWGMCIRAAAMSLDSDNLPLMPNATDSP
jgi:hypothetical protein